MRFPTEIPWPCLAGTTNHFNLDSGLGGGTVRFGQPETAHVMRRM